MTNSEPRRGGDAANNNNRKHASSIPGDQDPDTKGRDQKNDKAREVQPGTAEPGKSWHSRSPDLDDKDDQLNQSLKDSFPASDPAQATQGGATGWDLTKEEERKQKRSAA
jgi:hypothetical protein